MEHLSVPCTIPTPDSTNEPGLLRKLEAWLGGSGSHGYRLQNNRIVCGKGTGPVDIIEVSQIAEWQIGTQKTRSCVFITLHDGRIFHWIDQDGSLVSLLRRILEDREIPAFKMDYTPRY